MPPAYENSYAKVESRAAEIVRQSARRKIGRINTGTIGALAADFDLFRRAGRADPGGISGAEDEDSLIIILAVSLDGVVFPDSTTGTVAIVTGDPTKPTGNLSLGGLVLGLVSGTQVSKPPSGSFGFVCQSDQQQRMGDVGRDELRRGGEC